MYLVTPLTEGGRVICLLFKNNAAISIYGRRIALHASETEMKIFLK